MNVVLTGRELLHVLHSLFENPLSNEVENQALLDKIKKPILESLDKEQERIDDQLYQNWLEQESKKIHSLKQKNLGIKLPTKNRRK